MPDAPNILDQRCPAQQALDTIADKWAAIIVYALSSGTMRFGELQRSIGGVSQKMLTQTCAIWNAMAWSSGPCFRSCRRAWNIDSPNWARTLCEPLGRCAAGPSSTWVKCKLHANGIEPPNRFRPSLPSDDNSNFVRCYDMPDSALSAAQLLLGLLIIAGAVVAVFRRVDVRLAIGGAGLLLGIVGGDPWSVIRAFMASFVDPKTVIPICFAMGFAFVLKETGCDQHLVQLLVVPLRRARLLLVPGTVLVGFLVNIPIVSQTGTAASVGPVLIPLLVRHADCAGGGGSGAAIGCSIGGELMNPGGTQYGAITKGISTVTGRDVIQVECVEATQALELHTTGRGNARAVRIVVLERTRQRTAIVDATPILPRPRPKHFA